MEDADLTNERSRTIALKNNKSLPSCLEKQPAKNKHKYDSQYLSYGFTSIGEEKAPYAVCIFSRTILTNSSLASAKMQRHMETWHSDDINKDKYFLKRKRQSFSNEIGVFWYRNADQRMKI